MEDEVLDSLQKRLEEAVATVNATTTTMRNKINARFRIISEKWRRRQSPSVALPRGKLVERPTVEQFWVNGKASEDREEWMEEVRAHCERCYDGKDESSKVQGERIR